MKCARRQRQQVKDIPAIPGHILPLAKKHGNTFTFLQKKLPFFVLLRKGLHGTIYYYFCLRTKKNKANCLLTEVPWVQADTFFLARKSSPTNDEMPGKNSAFWCVLALLLRAKKTVLSGITVACNHHP